MSAGVYTQQYNMWRSKGNSWEWVLLLWNGNLTQGVRFAKSVLLLSEPSHWPPFETESHYAAQTGKNLQSFSSASLHLLGARTTRVKHHARFPNINLLKILNVNYINRFLFAGSNIWIQVIPSSVSREPRTFGMCHYAQPKVNCI